jgi:hypothetical protein
MYTSLFRDYFFRTRFSEKLQTVWMAVKPVIFMIHNFIDDYDDSENPNECVVMFMIFFYIYGHDGCEVCGALVPLMDCMTYDVPNVLMSVLALIAGISVVPMMFYDCFGDCDVCGSHVGYDDGCLLSQQSLCLRWPSSINDSLGIQDAHDGLVENGGCEDFRVHYVFDASARYRYSLAPKKVPKPTLFRKQHHFSPKPGSVLATLIADLAHRGSCRVVAVG